jgi:hypothetical protein
MKVRIVVDKKNVTTQRVAGIEGNCLDCPPNLSNQGEKCEFTRGRKLLLAFSSLPTSVWVVNDHFLTQFGRFGE